MKIICDNEYQKKEILYWLINDLCPSRFGMKSRQDDGTCNYDCDECWKETDLEVVLKEDEPQVAYLCDQKYCESCENPDCKHTLDITHAVNFEKIEGNKYMEKENKND